MLSLGISMLDFLEAGAWFWLSAATDISLTEGVDALQFCCWLKLEKTNLLEQGILLARVFDS